MSSSYVEAALILLHDGPGYAEEKRGKYFLYEKRWKFLRRKVRKSSAEAAEAYGNEEPAAHALVKKETEVGAGVAVASPTAKAVAARGGRGLVKRDEALAWWVEDKWTQNVLWGTATGGARQHGA